MLALVLIDILFPITDFVYILLLLNIYLKFSNMFINCIFAAMTNKQLHNTTVAELKEVKRFVFSSCI